MPDKDVLRAKGIGGRYSGEEEFNFSDSLDRSDAGASSSLLSNRAYVREI